MLAPSPSRALSSAPDRRVQEPPLESAPPALDPLASAPPIFDPAEALRPHEALLAALRGTVAVCIPDLTRPLDPGPALRALRERLPGRMRVVVGLGLHRRLRQEELAHLRGFEAVQSDPDDALPYGRHEEIPGLLSRPAAEADHRIALGLAELHQYAGLSGGHKAVVVGCGGRATIAALHARARVMAPGVRIGALEGNPFRAAIDALGAQAGVALALNRLPDGQWLAGEPRAVLARALERLRPWQPVDQMVEAAVLRVPPAKAQSFYQASRAATYLGLSPAPPVLEGGRLILDAACPEGLGSEEGFVAALRACPPPWTALLEGPEPRGAGAQRAVILALLARRYRLLVRGCADPVPLRAVGIDASAEPAPRGPDLLVVDEPFVRLPQRFPA